MLLIIIIISMMFFAFLGFKKPAIALVISPFATIAFVILAAREDSVEAAAFSTLIFITAYIAILLESESGSRRWPKICVKWILISLVVLIVTAVALVFCGVGGSFGIIVFISFISFLVNYMSTSRHATAAYVISTIGSSMRQNLPLAMALESASSGQTDKRSRILQSIKKWLIHGYSLSESIKRGYPKCPSRAVAMIAAAERINQLPLAIKAIETDMIAKSDENQKIQTIYPLYPIIIIIFMFIIILGLMTFVIPQFSNVLTEMFGTTPLPASTQILVRVTDFIVHQYGWLIGLISFLVFFVLIPVSVRVRLRPRRPDKPYLISRMADFVKWHFPVLRWFENNHSMVQVVEILRLSLSSGSCVNEAIANTLDLDINNCFKKRLRNWLSNVEAGNNIVDSARKSKLASSLAWAFDDKINQGNTLSILETLESFYRSNYNYRVNLFRIATGPCITIVMGMAVGFVVYSIFSPMVSLINHLVNAVTP